MYNLALGKKLDKEDFLREMSSKAVDDEKMKKAIESTDELHQKIEKLSDSFEKKLARLKKDMDMAQLLKMLKSKAEDEHVQKGFGNVDQKIAAISEALTLLKNEIETAQVSIKSVSTQVYRFSDNAILSTKPINPQQCLSCGNNIAPHAPHSQVKWPHLY